MSLQPSPLSNNNIAHSRLRVLLNFTEILSTQFSLESILTYIISSYERIFTCIPKIWLADSFIGLVRDESLLENTTLLSGVTDLIEQSRREKHFISDIDSRSSDGEKFRGIAIPLLIKDEVLGVIQLSWSPDLGINMLDRELLNGLCLQCSLALHSILQNNLYLNLSQKVEYLNSAAQISRSITSNLDIDNLINSVITLIHQRFGFSKVNLFIIESDEDKEFTRIGISHDGIEPLKSYSVEKDNGPVSWSISNKESIIINDTVLDERFPHSSFDRNTRSELVIPLFSGELIVGILDLCSDIAYSFNPDTVRLFQSLADNIALAIRNANLYRAVQINNLVTDRLKDVFGAISPDISLDDVLHKLLAELEKFLPCDASAIWLLRNTDSDTGVDQFVITFSLAAYHINEQFFSGDDRANLVASVDEINQYLQNIDNSIYLLSKYPWVSEIIRSKTPVIRNSTSSFEPLGGLLAFDNRYSAIGAPLIIDEQSIGIIILVHHLPWRYDKAAQALASTFANYAAILIENTRLYTAAHNQAWLSTVILQVTEATQSIASLDELFETVASMLPGLLGVNACIFYLWDQSLEAFFPQASIGFNPDQQSRLSSWDIYTGTVPAFDQLILSRNPVILNSDTLSDDIITNVFPSYDFGTSLIILFPMIAQNNLRGAIIIDFTDATLDKKSPQELWDEKYALIQGVANQTAVTIENLQLIKSQEEEAYISVALLQVAQAIVSLNQLDEILGSIVRITPILVGVKRCIIYLWDNKELVIRQSQYYGFSKNEISSLGQIIKTNEFPLIETILQQNQIIYVQLNPGYSGTDWSELSKDEFRVIKGIIFDTDQQNSIKLDDKSLNSIDHLLIGFPLSVKGEMLGVMLIEEEEVNKGSPSLHIREKRIEIVQGITQQAAIAIKNEHLQQEAVNSERMERELQLAREIQTTFLPDRLPKLLGWDMDIRWQPARQVGGDFYDIILFDENHLGFVIADVADKGMPAALFMTLIRTLIRAAAIEKSSPAAVLKQVNELLVPDAKHGMFVTVFYAVFSLDTGAVKYANAGHNPPIIKYLSSDELIELNRTGMALGLYEDIEIEEREVLLNPGDWMFFYTDGVTEAFSLEGEAFGTERLSNLLTQGQKFLTSYEMLDLIEGSVNDFIKGMDLSDDMTLAAIIRKVAE